MYNSAVEVFAELPRTVELLRTKELPRMINIMHSFAAQAT